MPAAGEQLAGRGCAIVGSAWARRTAVDLVTLSHLLQGWVLTPLVACLLGLVGAVVMSWVAEKRGQRGFLGLDPVLRTALLAACAWGAFALGANNAANVSGVVVASGLLTPGQGAWLAGISIALGIVTFGGRLLYLVGRGLVRLEPTTALVTMLAQASTVHLFAIWGVPVSTSQALAGGALGIGLAKGVRTIGRRALLHVSWAGWRRRSWVRRSPTSWCGSPCRAESHVAAARNTLREQISLLPKRLLRDFANRLNNPRSWIRK